MHEKVLPRNSVQLLTNLEAMGSDFLKGWILAGGTGLALHYGHRVSDDFDFFRNDHMDVRALHTIMRDIGPYETLQESTDTLTLLIRGVKLSFFNVRDPFILEAIPYRFFGVATPDEIALMKLVAISGRGSRKDFIDLYTIVRREKPLRAYFQTLPEKYGQSRINMYHILKSLTYFEDAEREPMPRMLEPFDWKACKGLFMREAHTIVLPVR